MAEICVIKIGLNALGETIVEVKSMEATCKMEQCLRKGKIHYRLLCKEMEWKPGPAVDQEIPTLKAIFEDAGIQG